MFNFACFNALLRRACCCYFTAALGVGLFGFVSWLLRLVAICLRG